MRGKVTKRKVDGLVVPGGADEATLWDTEIKGFGIRARASGTKTYILHYRAGCGRAAPLRKVTNPVVVLGPVMGSDYSASVQVVSRLMQGQMPGIPNLGFTYVDVRDVADLHLRAMVSPQAAGERFIAASEFLWMGEVAEILRAHFGPRAAKVPKRLIPDFVVRGIALFDRPVASVLSALSNRREYSGAKARRVLDWKPRPAREAIIDCAESLLEKGLL